MSVNFELVAERRQDAGKGASRRLRRAGKVPAIIYGGEKAPQQLALPHDELMHMLENEAFYSSILDVKIDGQNERAIVRDLQRHPYKPAVLHMDLLRVSEDQEIKVQVPLHFINEEKCRGVRQDGGEISHVLNELEVVCLPKNLPEYIEVDVADLGLGETIHLSELKLPDGVQLAQGAPDEEHDTAIVNVHHVRTSAAADEEGSEDDGGEGEEEA